MAITILGYDGNPATQFSLDATPNNFIFGCHRASFSGSYSTGGDTLDWTNGGVNSIATQIPSLAGLITAFADGNGPATSQSGTGGYYQLIPGTNLTNWKLKIFSAGGAELGAGAYPAAVTSDLVFLQSLWRKFA